jgi:hypothetical protein
MSAAIDPQTLFLMRETVRIALSTGATVREAIADVVILSHAIAPEMPEKDVRAVIDDLLIEVVPLLVDLAHCEPERVRQPDHEQGRAYA